MQGVKLEGVAPDESTTGGTIGLFHRMLERQQKTAGHQEERHTSPGHFLQTNHFHVEKYYHQREYGTPAVYCLNHQVKGLRDYENLRLK